jgi:hypothetical protein
MIDSPGGIQAQHVTIKTERLTVKLHPPEGTIATDRQRLNYIKHLIDRYNDFASKQPGRQFKYMAIYSDIKKRFGAKWDRTFLARFDDLSLYLQGKIDRTLLGSINRGGGKPNYSSFEKYVAKYDQGA